MDTHKFIAATSNTATTVVKRIQSVVFGKCTCENLFASGQGRDGMALDRIGSDGTSCFSLVVLLILVCN